MMKYLKQNVFVCVCVHAQGTCDFANDHFPVSNRKGWKAVLMPGLWAGDF